MPDSASDSAAPATALTTADPTTTDLSDTAPAAAPGDQAASVESAPPRRLTVPDSPSSVRIFITLLRWNTAQLGPMLPLVVVVQLILAAGIIIGFGLLIPNLDTATAQFLSTGAPTVLIAVIGLVVVPMGVSQARTSGTFSHFRAQPVPRALVLISDLVLWLGASLPAVPVAALVAYLRYDFSYSFSWPVLVAATVLGALTAATLGYAMAVVLPPMLTQMATQVLVFFVLLFSPVTFPTSQLPGWYQGVHEWLPFQPTADLIRAGLLGDSFEASGRDFAVLGVWCTLGLIVSLRALTRRG